MKGTLLSLHFILPPSSFILPETPSLTVGLLPRYAVLRLRRAPTRYRGGIDTATSPHAITYVLCSSI